MSVFLICSVTDLFYCDYLLRSLQQPLYSFVRNINHSWWNYVFITLLVTLLRKVKPVFTISFVLFMLHKAVPTIFVFKKISSALLVGYNNIHPILFYIFLSSAVFYLLIDEVQKVWPIDKLMVGSTVTLFLGGLWGAGNSAWGFFWVNDSIEILLFKYICLLLVFIHTHTLAKRKKYVFVGLAAIVIQLLILRWGFTFTRHSFFNLSTTTNVYKLFILFFNISSRLFIIFFISIDHLMGFGLFFLITYFIVLFTNSLTSTPANIIVHTTVLVLALSWLKIKAHNLTIFTVPEIFVKNLFTYSSTSSTLDNFFLNLRGDTHTIVRTVANYVYSYKSYLNNYIILQSWSRFFLLILLVSMWKI